MHFFEVIFFYLFVIVFEKKNCACCSLEVHCNE